MPDLARTIVPVISDWAEENDLETSGQMECELADQIVAAIDRMLKASKEDTES